MKTISKLLILATTLFLASCGAKKAMVKHDGMTTTAPTAEKTSATARKMAFVQKVSDTKVYAKNIVANLSFNAKMGGKDITVPGALRMRRDEVIRLQLFIPLLGSEVGRLEFTPDYVLVIDRMHKQYVKGGYDRLDFLRDNGLNFYTLQALFWNQLLIPGITRVGEGDLQKFDVNIDGNDPKVPVSLKNGNMNFLWQADRQSGLIGEADVTYSTNSHGNSKLTWKYDDFRPLGAKKFPAVQEFSFSTTATNKVKTTTVRLEMNDLKTNENWEPRSTVSDKYKQMDVRDILGKLLNM